MRFIKWHGAKIYGTTCEQLHIDDAGDIVPVSVWRSLSDDNVYPLKNKVIYEDFSIQPDIIQNPIVIIMVGIPGSGKSTIASEISRSIKQNSITVCRPTKIFSSDEYRERLLRDVNCQSNNDLIFSTLIEDAKRAIQDENSNVIIDATNIRMKKRMSMLQNITRGSCCYKIAYVVNTPAGVCLQRDSERERSVGKEVIDKFARGFSCPQYFEGFNEIIFHDTHAGTNLKTLNYYIDLMNTFDQNNPHHIYSLGRHCEIVAQNYVDPVMHTAGILHDIGKLFTQTTDERNISHYYSHDNVGTYFVASNVGWLGKLHWDDALKVLFIINYHMRAHQDFESDKSYNKYKNIFGKEWLNDLLEFAENDKKASGTYDIHEDIKKKIEGEIK